MNVGLLLLIVLAIIIFIALIVWAGVDSVSASYDIKRIKGYKNNEGLKTAHKYMSIASSICWLTVIIGIVIAFFAFPYAPQLFAFSSVGGGFSAVTIVFIILLIIILGLLLGVGVFAAMSWDLLRKNKVQDNKRYDQALSNVETVTYLTIGTLSIIALVLVIYVVTRIIVSEMKKAKIKKEKEQMLDFIVQNA